MRLLLCVLVCMAWLAPAPALAQDMALKDVMVDGQGWELVGEGFKFTEGPAADGRGNVYFTDVGSNRIHKISPDGQVGVFQENAMGANGLMFGPDGRLFGCVNGMRAIAAYHTDGSGTVDILAKDVACNDLVVDKSGGVYFTDPETHRVWYANSAGEKRVVDEGLAFPNGIILWPDGGTLVVADTMSENLWTFRVEADGGLAFKQPYYTLRMPSPPDTGVGGSGADGMTVDEAGRLYVATHEGLQMFDPTGRLGGVIAKPQPAFLSNVAFGGPDMNYLYVTSSDKVYRRLTKARGCAWD